MDIIGESSHSRPVHHLDALRRQWWVVAAAVAVGLAVGGIVAAATSDVYRAKASIVAGPRDAFLADETSVEPFTQTMRSLLESDAVARSVASQTEGLTRQEFSDHLAVTSRAESSVIDVMYEAGTQQEAVVVLGRAVDAFQRLVDDRLAMGDTPSPVRVAVFDVPHGVGPAGPSAGRTLLFAALAALVVGLGIALLREQSPQSVRSLEDAERAVGAPVLGALPGGLPAVPFGKEATLPADDRLLAALDDLRANVALAAGGVGPRVVTVTGADTGRRADVVANLALVFSLAGDDVVCVGADAPEPFVRAFGVRGAKGAVESVVAGRQTLAEALTPVWFTPPAQPPAQNGARMLRRRGASSAVARLTSPSGVGRVWALPSTSPTGVGALRADQVDALLAAARERADVVLVEAPSLLDGARAFPFVEESDLVLVHVERDRTRLQPLEAARRRLSALAAGRIGIVLTGAGAAMADVAPREVAGPLVEVKAR
jgi:capsular polysaccharide biosynthesis protein/MinD-like ATPase involved in chromosome partitioning or flagellar assembly